MSSTISYYYFIIIIILSFLSFVNSFSIVSFRSLPAWQTNSNSANSYRDAGLSGLVGTSSLWAFGDTFSPGGLLSSTAGINSNLSAPWIIREDVNSNNNPYNFYPFTTTELQFNSVHANPPECCKSSSGCPSDNLYCNCAAGTDCLQRYALWPGSIFPLNSTTSVNVYGSLYCGWALFDFRNIGVGISYLRAGSTVATRTLNATNGNPVYIFKPNEPTFTEGVLANYNSVPSVFLYAFANAGFCAMYSYIAKVPLSRIADRSAYTFWDGSTWNTDITRVTSIATVLSGLGSVIYSDYLGAYLSASHNICSGPMVDFRTAPNPWGPWSNPVSMNISTVSGGGTGTYAGALHTEYSRGNTILFSFFSPSFGRIVLVNVTLAR